MTLAEIYELIDKMEEFTREFRMYLLGLITGIDAGDIIKAA